MATMSTRVRMAIRVQGVVQGVGFRPFVYSLATSLGLAGLVGNDTDGVFAQVEGPETAVAEFLARLEREAPPLSRVDHVTATSVPLTGAAGFEVAPSDPGGPRRVLVSPDAGTCADCLRELADPADRRFGYAFINCTNCGPRFTIVRDVPYDRALTTMASFEMCEQCAAEYRDPADRRFHAQPTCCPACGPRLVLAGPDGGVRGGDPVATTADLLKSGQVLAIKGLGGYHLACDAGSEAAAAALRSRKHREDKPFALMVADVAMASRLCVVDDAAAAALTSRRRPIVLLPRREAADVAAAVAPGNRHLGIMLPYTALHHLLLAAVGRPLVLTSGNVSDEPIAYVDVDATTRLAGIADAFLTHDRAIHMRADDSVVRIFGNRERLVRRSRGYAPEPMSVSVPFTRPVLACGAELKSTFCLAKDGRAFISQHIGDLQNAETLRSFTEGVAHFGRLFEVTPQVIAHDLHPDYLSTKYAVALAESGLPGAASGAGPGEGEVDLCPVQHHHAHIASCLADNGEPGPVIGVAFDGTGYGADGTIWGGEFLTADLVSFERAGHLSPVPMPGGAAAITQPWRMAAAYLDAAYPGDDRIRTLGVARRNEQRWDAVTVMARRGVNSPVTSSAGRLFDAAAAILDVKDAISYEGQAAIELEQLADPHEQAGYRAGVHAGGRPGEPIVADGTDLIRAICADLAAGVPRETVAARFHQGVAALIEDCCVQIRDQTGLSAVALSGGVFQNMLLLAHVENRLAARGFRVLLHARVPCNDGGISLGQAVVAGARDRIGCSASQATRASPLR
jgi:hydrogenase maturation protein HypF